MKPNVNIIIVFFMLTIISGFQCNKDIIATEPAKELFREKINLFPFKKTYNINDTIWLTFTTTDKTLFDTLSNQRLPTNGLKFNFRAVILPLYNTPTVQRHPNPAKLFSPGNTQSRRIIVYALNQRADARLYACAVGKFRFATSSPAE